jgi:preprotein translocase subunit SecF
LTTFFVVLSVFLFGGPVINDFAFTMMVGVIAGTYSTMFIACPIVVDWPWSKKISR